LTGFLIDVGDDILSEIQDTVKVAAADIQQEAQIAGHPARVPDVGNRGSQDNVPHALAAHGGAGDFHAAFVADDTLVANVLVLAAVALPILGRTKDGLTEEAVFFRP